MRLVVGDETGLIKVVSVEEGRVVRTLGSQQRDYGVECLCWADERPDAEPSVAAAGLKSGTVLLFDAANEALRPKAVGKPGGKAVRGVAAIPDGRLAVCSEEGALDVYRADPEALFAGGDEEEAPEPLESLSVGKPISVMRADREGRAAVGGKEHDLELYDLATKQRVFQAKNVPDSKLSLRVPVWVADLAFVPNEPDLVALVSGHRHFRLYDRRKQRRPVVSVELGENPLASLAVTPDAKMAIAGDGQGTVRQVDFRTGKELGVFKGEFAGAVRSASAHPRASAVATACLDRFVRVHNSQTRAKVLKLYCKQKLTAVLFSHELPKPSAACTDPAERHGLRFYNAADGAAYARLKAALKKKKGREDGAEGSSKRQRGDEEEDEEEEEEESDGEGDGEDPYAQIFGPAAAAAAAAAARKQKEAAARREEDEEPEGEVVGDEEGEDEDEEGHGSGSEDDDDEEEEGSGDESDEEVEEEAPPPAKGKRPAAGAKAALAAQHKAKASAAPSRGAGKGAARR